ncbi:MAG: ABC transporter ATP-binding protein [Sarcina sp.]
MNIVEYKNLKVSFKTDSGIIKAVDDVSFELRKGEILGIVGESGSGKSVTAMSLMGLLSDEVENIQSGEILLHGVDITKFNEKQMVHIRGKEISAIYQDPLTSLNPVYTIGHQIIEGILIHKKVSKKEAKLIAIEMLKKVGINNSEKVFDSYPNELSGGMRQRALIAMALCLKPKVLIADEITTALDVTVQAQILELLKEIKAEFDMSIIVITHDLGIIAELCDRVVVMYGGKVVEEADVFTIFDDAKHPYTKALLKSRPSVEFDFEGVKELESIRGNVLSPYEVLDYCAFYDRCDECIQECKQKSIPFLKQIDKQHKVACYIAKGESNE